MNSDLTQLIVQGLAAAIKSLRLYPPQHPAVQRQFTALQGSFAAALADREVLRLNLLEGSLFVDNLLQDDEQAAARDLSRLFLGLELDGLEFHSGLNSDELVALITLIDSGEARSRQFGERLSEQGVRNIRVIFRQTDGAEELPPPRQIYNRALAVVDSIFQDVRLGRIPAAEDAREIVRDMARLTITEPQTLFALSMLKDYDNYTFTHSVNVSVIALAVGRACGLEGEQLRTLGLGALLHDLGKLKVDPGIINKPGRLNAEELEKIRQHPRTGAEIVAQMKDVAPEVIDIVLGHHLHYNRRGYPTDALGKTVSPLADMAAIADAYDAMTTLRAYQQPVTPRQAIKLLHEIAGTILHPEFVERFIASLGPYPVGTLVRLDDNTIALVTGTGDNASGELRLKILLDGEGTLLREPLLLNLQAGERQRIVAEVDPLAYGIEVGEYLILGIR